MLKLIKSTTVALTLLIAPGAALAQSNELVIALSSDIRSLNGERRDQNTDNVLHHIYETLVAFRSDLTVGPALAESWEVTDDGTSYVFTIRDGATFHDGSPVTAEDMVWSWNWRMDPVREHHCLNTFNGERSIEVTSVKAIDDRRIEFLIAEPSALFLTRLAEIQCNIFAFSDANVDENGEWIDGFAIGSGSFMLSEWTADEAIRLSRYKDYVPLHEERSGYAGDRTALVENLIFQIIPDATVRETALLSGDVDIITDVAAERASLIEERGGKVYAAAGLGWTPILLQTEDTLLSDVRLRRAIAHSIDYDQIAEIKTNGLAGHNPSAVWETSAYFNESFLEWPSYDIAAAQALAAEAGYDGELLKLQVNNRYSGMYQNAILVQAMLQAAGFNVEIETLEWGTQLDNFLAGTFQLQSFGFSARLDPALIYGNFLGDKTADPSNQWQNDAAYEIYLKTLTETDFEQRQALFLELHNMMVEDVPIIGLYYTPNVDAVGGSVEGYSIWSAGNPIGWGVSPGK